MKLRVRSRLEGYVLCFKQLYVRGLTFCPCERSVVRHHFPFHLSPIEVEIVLVIALMKQKDIRTIPKSDPNTCLFLVGTLQKEYHQTCITTKDDSRTLLAVVELGPGNVILAVLRRPLDFNIDCRPPPIIEFRPPIIELRPPIMELRPPNIMLPLW